MSMIRIFQTCRECVEFVKMTPRGIILWELLYGDYSMEVVLWGFVDDLNVIPSPRVLSKYLFLFLCIYLEIVIIFVCICSFNLAFEHFCKQNLNL